MSSTANKYSNSKLKTLTNLKSPRIRTSSPIFSSIPQRQSTFSSTQVISQCSTYNQNSLLAKALTMPLNQILQNNQSSRTSTTASGITPKSRKTSSISGLSSISSSKQKQLYQTIQVDMTKPNQIVINNQTKLQNYIPKQPNLKKKNKKSLCQMTKASYLNIGNSFTSSTPTGSQTRNNNSMFSSHVNSGVQNYMSQIRTQQNKQYSFNISQIKNCSIVLNTSKTPTRTMHQMISPEPQMQDDIEYMLKSCAARKIQSAYRKYISRKQRIQSLLSAIENFKVKQTTAAFDKLYENSKKYMLSKILKIQRFWLKKFKPSNQITYQKMKSRFRAVLQCYRARKAYKWLLRQNIGRETLDLIRLRNDHLQKCLLQYQEGKKDLKRDSFYHNINKQFKVKVAEFNMQFNIQVEKIKKGKPFEIPTCRDSLRLLSDRIMKRKGESSVSSMERGNEFTMGSSRANLELSSQQQAIRTQLRIVFSRIENIILQHKDSNYLLDVIKQYGNQHNIQDCLEEVRDIYEKERKKKRNKSKVLTIKDQNL